MLTTKIFRKIYTLFNYSGYVSGSLVLGCLLTGPINAQESIAFTAEQAATGKVLYRDNCQICHGSTLSNGQFGTPLRGSFFRKNMSEKSLGELIQYTYESMPPDNVMLLAPQQYAEIIAFILERNKIEPGDVEISGDYANLYETMLPW